MMEIRRKSVRFLSRKKGQYSFKEVQEAKSCLALQSSTSAAVQRVLRCSVYCEQPDLELIFEISAGSKRPQTQQVVDHLKFASVWDADLRSCSLSIYIQSGTLKNASLHTIAISQKEGITSVTASTA